MFIGKDGIVKTVYSGINGATVDEALANLKKEFPKELDTLLAARPNTETPTK